MKSLEKFHKNNETFILKKRFVIHVKFLGYTSMQWHTIREPKKFSLLKKNYCQYL